MRLRVLALASLTLALSGCSLISLKSPERPLSNRDLNARILTREYSYHFVAAVAHCADDISAADADPQVQVNALRWKIAAATESAQAATRIAPMMAVLDTWALADQMQVFLTPGEPGGALFGAHQQCAVAVANELDGDARELARRLIAPGEIEKYQRFVSDYTQQHPLSSLQLVRPSVVELWSESQVAGLRLIDSMGTIPEAMADFSDRLKISSDALTLQAMWRTELALRSAGYGGSDVHAALRQLDERLAKLSDAAQNAPQLVQGAIDDVRHSLIDVLQRVDSSSNAMIAAFRSEREALAGNVRGEREALVVAADVQRQAIAQDAARIADQVVKASGDEARRLAREVLLLLIVLAAVVLGMPFAAGYAVGRARGRARAA